MGDDWDTVTKIGSKARGGASRRETVVRGKSALNAAQRSGAIIGTEKKFGAGNSASKPSVEGQHLTRVDRSDDIVKPKLIDRSIGTLIMNRRNEEAYKMTQKELATKCSTNSGVIQGFESGTAISDQKVLSTIERVLNIHLRGAKMGEKKDEKKP